MDGLCVMLKTYLIIYVILSNTLYLVSLWIKDSLLVLKDIFPYQNNFYCCLFLNMGHYLLHRRTTVTQYSKLPTAYPSTSIMSGLGGFLLS